MNKTACFGFPFLFITLVGFVSLKKRGNIIPVPSSLTRDEREQNSMVVFPHHHFYCIVMERSFSFSLASRCFNGICVV